MVTWRALWAQARGEPVSEMDARRVLDRAAQLEGIDWIAALDQPAGIGGESVVASMVARLKGGEPLQYILGQWGFRNLDLVVDDRALIPRPETEQVVSEALAELSRISGRVIVDLGTGSGAIALSLITEVVDSEVWAVDSSPAALSLAEENLRAMAPNCRARAQLRLGSWYEPLPEAIRGRVDLVISNPPYIAEDEIDDLPPQVWDWEPRLALVAGPTGREAITRVLEGAPGWLARPGVAVI
ncbi:MAG: HemK/PrmC family methyltransferase, partial [Acidimicrobiales bacterium]